MEGFSLKSSSTNWCILSGSHRSISSFSDIFFRTGKTQFLFSTPKQVIVRPCLKTGGPIFGHFDMWTAYHANSKAPGHPTHCGTVWKPRLCILSGEPQLFQSAGQFILRGDSLPCYRLSSIGLCSSSLISLFWQDLKWLHLPSSMIRYLMTGEYYLRGKVIFVLFASGNRFIITPWCCLIKLPC